MEDDVSSQLHPPRLRRGWSSARAFAASSTRVGARGFARARTMAGTMLARSSIASLAMLALSCGATSAPAATRLCARPIRRRVGRRVVTLELGRPPRHDDLGRPPEHGASLPSARKVRAADARLRHLPRPERGGRALRNAERAPAARSAAHAHRRVVSDGEVHDRGGHPDDEGPPRRLVVRLLQLSHPSKGTP